MTSSTGTDPPPATASRQQSTSLPLVETPPALAVSTNGIEPIGEACSVDDDGCITCGDVAWALTVVELAGDDARCQDVDGRSELVATDLVGEVAVGDLLLVHAGVALEQLDPALQHDER